MLRVVADITSLWIAIVKRIAQLVVGIPVVMHVVWRRCVYWHSAVYCSGVWEIVCEVPFDIGAKVIRYPLEYTFINRHTNDYLVSYMLKVVFA